MGVGNFEGGKKISRGGEKFLGGKKVIIKSFGK